MSAAHKLQPAWHWVLSDCVNRAALHAHPIACAPNLEAITCRDCLGELARCRDRWLEDQQQILQLELYALRSQVAAARAHLRELEGREQAAIAAHVAGPLKCPACGLGVLEPRLNGRTGQPFLGCSRFPQCRHTRAG